MKKPQSPFSKKESLKFLHKSPKTSQEIKIVVKESPRVFSKAESNDDSESDYGNQKNGKLDPLTPKPPLAPKLTESQTELFDGSKSEISSSSIILYKAKTKDGFRRPAEPHSEDKNPE